MKTYYILEMKPEHIGNLKDVKIYYSTRLQDSITTTMMIKPALKFYNKKAAEQFLDTDANGLWKQLDWFKVVELNTEENFDGCCWEDVVYNQCRSYGGVFPDQSSQEE